MVTTGLRYILGVQRESSGAVNSVFPISSAWMSGSSRERQDHFWMWRHTSLRVLSLLMFALLVLWWGDGHQQVTYGYIPMCALWHGLTTMLSPGLLKGRGKWWSDHSFSTLCPWNGGNYPDWLHLTTTGGHGAHGRDGRTEALAFLKYKISKGFSHACWAPWRWQDSNLCHQLGRGCPQLLQTKLAPGAEML